MMSANPVNTNEEPDASNQKLIRYTSKASFLSRLFAYTFSIFGSYVDFSFGAWKKILSAGPMRRFQELIQRTSKRDVLSSDSDLWLLGICYKVASEESAYPDNGADAFLNDFSSRIWMTYRKGFDAILDSKFTSDAKWGCMIRSSQMLIAQALVFHHMGRSWRKALQKPYDPEYIEILHLFGDSVASSFSIHNLLEAGKAYGLATGSWVGPYAMCRTWETLVHLNSSKQKDVNGNISFPMAIYIVSDNEDGERGGAPVVCVEGAAELCYEFNKGKLTWSPILLLVPLVLGLENVNPRYVPSLRETLKFPQSLGILGGKPGASTYIVGVQDDKALYLDPHQVQLAIDIGRQSLDADTSSYHCNIVRHLPLDQMDPSLALGFYCRDKGDFEDFCSRASDLKDISDGAPLFTVAQSLQHTKIMKEAFDADSMNSFATNAGEDEWQFL